VPKKSRRKEWKIQSSGQDRNNCLNDWRRFYSIKGA
jgi:hypothetical protein